MAKNINRGAEVSETTWKVATEKEKQSGSAIKAKTDCFFVV
ncbi:MAG: hypothetical protein AAB486_02790 [Patescibacteria group bacterium]